VFSDSHGRLGAMVDAIERERPQRVFFLGDHYRDGQELAGAYPDLPMELVKGNCDWDQAPDELLVEAGGVRVLLTHGHPYGVKSGEIAPLRADSVYTVAAGTSQWKAVESFCRTYGGFSPRFSREGALLAGPERPGRTLSIGEGDPVLSCSLREDHYGVLTEALVIDKTRNKTSSVKNQEMIDKGGQCRRVIYTPGQSTWAAMRYTGEYQIQRSKEDAWLAEVTLPGGFPAFPGDRVALSLERMGLSGTFRVAEVESRFDSRNGAAATLTLKPVSV